MRERLQQRIACTLGFVLLDHATDRMFRRTLRDHHHRHLRGAQRCEDALGRARHTDQTGAFQIQHRQIRAQRQPLDRPPDRTAGSDARAGMLGLEGVTDDDRQAAFDRRRHRLRMHYLRTEIRQLTGLVVAQRFQLHRFGHHARIGRQHAVHIGPDMQFVGIEQCSENRTGVIAAVASQCGDAIGAIARHESGHHHARLRMRLPPRGKLLRAHFPVHIHTEFAAIDHQHIACVQHRAVFADRAKVIAQQLRRIHLAQALHAVEHLARQFADHRQCAEDLRQVFEAFVQPLNGRPGMLTQQGHRGTAMARTRFVPAIAPLGTILCGQFGQLDQASVTPFIAETTVTCTVSSRASSSCATCR